MSVVMEEPEVELYIEEREGAAVLHVYRGEVEITKLTGRTETVKRVAAERFPGVKLTSLKLETVRSAR